MANELADRIRTIVGHDPNIGEIRMFGGVCFTLNGNMLVGTMKDGTLLARVGEDREADALVRPGASRMNFGGREMKGFLIVAPEQLDGDALRQWIALASAYVGPLPPKAARAAKKPRKRAAPSR